MTLHGKRALATILVLLAVSGTAVAYANSPYIPSVIILVDRAPEDVTVEVLSPDDWIWESKKVVGWETYFVFHVTRRGAAEFRVSGGGKSFTIRVESFAEGEGFDSVATVDFDTQKVTPGKLPLRTALLAVLRVVMTLMIEGQVFALFGFRRMRSWIVFVAVNLVTQTFLYASISGTHPFMSYPIFSLLFIEFFIFIAEMLAFPLLVREHGVGRREAYAFLANAAGLALGWYMFMILPI